MTATINGAPLADQVRQLLASAREAGEQAPGRPTLAKLTGATDYAVRKALAELEEPAGVPGDDAGEAVAVDPPAVAAPADVEPPVVVAEDGASEPLAGPGEALATAVARPQNPGAKFVAWAGFLFGSITSVAANVLAARIAPEHAPAGWQPALDAQLGAAVWPLGLLLSVEVLSRVRWPAGWQWNLAKFGGAGAVALGSAVISYGHIADVLTSWRYSNLGAHVGPVVIDGLMTICGFALLATAGDKADSAGDKAGE